QACMALIVAMAQAPGQQVGNRLETAMRMLRKPARVVARLVGAELVEQEEWIEHVEVALADQAIEFDPGTVADRLAAQDADNGSKGAGSHGLGHAECGWAIARLVRSRRDGRRADCANLRQSG